MVQSEAGLAEVRPNCQRQKEGIGRRITMRRKNIIMWHQQRVRKRLRKGLFDAQTSSPTWFISFIGRSGTHPGAPTRVRALSTGWFIEKKLEATSSPEKDGVVSVDVVVVVVVDDGASALFVGSGNGY